MVEEDKEQVKFKMWAGFASEEKMRDELKMKEIPVLITRSFFMICTHNIRNILEIFKGFHVAGPFKNWLQCMRPRIKAIVAHCSKNPKLCKLFGPILDFNFYQ